MDILISDDADFDDETISSAIDLTVSLEIVTHSLPQKTQEYMSALLSKYLEEFGLADYYNKLNFCLSEILFNAVKANVKRIYFEERKLDIDNNDDYAEGMKNFRTDTLSNKNYYFEKLRDSDLYVTLSLKIIDGKLIIEVRNNSVMNAIEAERVKQKIASFHDFTSADMDSGIVDESEGAGLGISTILLTLRSFGLPGDHYKLYTTDKETIARLIIEDEPLLEI